MGEVQGRVSGTGTEWRWVEEEGDGGEREGGREGAAEVQAQRERGGGREWGRYREEFQVHAGRVEVRGGEGGRAGGVEGVRGAGRSFRYRPGRWRWVEEEVGGSGGGWKRREEVGGSGGGFIMFGSYKHDALGSP